MCCSRAVARYSPLGAIGDCLASSGIQAAVGTRFSAIASDEVGAVVSSLPQLLFTTMIGSFRKFEFVQRTLLIGASLLLLASCKPTNPWAEAKNSRLTQTYSSQTSSANLHNLSADESLGGHTLKRHVGRTDQQLQQRLNHDAHISAASTYSDQATAETVIAGALSRNQEKIARWMERSRHPNLVLDYDDREPIGRTLHRGERQSQPCSHAIIVLRWDPPNGYHVLTSYPECR